MKRISILYWSGTGNTEKMAELITDGLKKSNGQNEFQVVMKPVSAARAEDIENSDLVVLGSPAMGAEEIDDTEMAPFIRKTIDAYKDKLIALFGSFGWGDGEWMENWQAMMESYGAKIVADGLMIMDAPEGRTEETCINYGERLYSMLHE